MEKHKKDYFFKFCQTLRRTETNNKWRLCCFVSKTQLCKSMGEKIPDKNNSLLWEIMRLTIIFSSEKSCCPSADLCVCRKRLGGARLLHRFSSLKFYYQNGKLVLTYLAANELSKKMADVSHLYRPINSIYSERLAVAKKLK